jgi:ABC-type amino acid transport system permease subunit
MVATESTQELSTNDLRIFGFLFGAAFGGIIGFAIPLLRHRQAWLWPWGVTIVVWTISAVAPRALRQFHGIWMKAGHGMAMIQSRIILALIFFIVVTPLGWLLRLVRGRRPREADIVTYRVPSDVRSIQSMEKPF